MLRRAFLVALGVMLVVGTLRSCDWLRYADLARTHAGLLERLATDAADSVVAGHRLSNADIETLRYPLQRADGFVRSSDDGEARPSLEALRETVAAYAALVDLLDKLRVREASGEDVAAVTAAARRVAELAARTRAALNAEA